MKRRDSFKSHIWMFATRLLHVAHMTYYTYAQVPSLHTCTYVEMIHVCDETPSCRTHESCAHIRAHICAHMKLLHEGVSSHTWIISVTRVNESCHTCECGTHTKESCHTYRVASVSRIDRIVRLFCRISVLYRALLQKRPKFLSILLTKATT